MGAKMRQPKSKYDYPGLPLWDRDGNPVGVGDRLKALDGGSFPEIRITEFEGLPGYTLTGFKGVMPLAKLDLKSIKKDWSLVMPPGFPKDRRRSGFPSDPVRRFVDEWHFWTPKGRHANPHKSFRPCSDTAHWTHDGDGNPVQSEATTEDSSVVEAATQDEVNGLLQSQVDELERRLDDLERCQRDLNRERWQTSTAKANAEAHRVEPAPLPTDPDEWEECGSGETCYRRHVRAPFIVKFDGEHSGVVVASNDDHNRVGNRSTSWIARWDSNYWTPVRPRRREVEPTPDHELRDWFYDNFDRVEADRFEDGQVDLYWLKPDHVSRSGIDVRGNTFDAALRSLREQVEAAERSGQEGGR